MVEDNLDHNSLVDKVLGGVAGYYGGGGGQYVGGCCVDGVVVVDQVSYPPNSSGVENSHIVDNSAGGQLLVTMDHLRLTEYQS